MPPKSKHSPKLATVDALVDLLRIDWMELHWLEHARYHHVSIPKQREGQERLISKPPDDLNAVQHIILRELLFSGHRAEPQAHGFVPGRSILTGAKPHVGRRIVVNLDLKDFFPSVLFYRVLRMFRKLGHAEEVAQSLARLCTETSGTDPSLHARHLPQGACTSPAITNIICRDLDRRLDGLARKHGFVYTRYADDLTFSGDDGRKMQRVLSTARHIIKAEGFDEHPDKTRIMRRRRKVTGLVVSDSTVNVSRRKRRRMRALLHNAEKTGLETQNREGVERFDEHLKGRVAYLCMVDPARSDRWQAALDKALQTETL